MLPTPARASASTTYPPTPPQPKTHTQDACSFFKFSSPITRPVLKKAEWQQAEIAVKYEGYIKRQFEQVERFAKNEKKIIPEDIDYSKVYGLRTEARQKLEKMRPENVGRASRISGVSPADIGVLLIYLSSFGKN